MVSRPNGQVLGRCTWRTTACHALGIPSCHVSEDTHLKTIHANKFSLTPRRIPVERKTAAKQEVDQEMVAREEGKFDQTLMLRVDGQECRTTPPLTQSVRMLRPYQLPQTWIDLTQPMMLFVTWPMACTTLTSDGVPEESPVKMRQVFCWLMATRSCRPLWVKAKGIEEVLNTHWSHITTFV